MRVDFHYNVDHRLQYACRITRKARAAGKTVLAYAREPDRLARFDAALWTFSALDFLPHVYADSPLVAHTPIVLTLSARAAPRRDVLLTLDDNAPEDFGTWFAQFERVVEVVSQDAQERAQARERVSTYRAAGIEPTMHKAQAE